MNAERIYEMIPGKSGKNESYLPLWLHLADTASVMEDLCSRTVADSVIRACEMTREAFTKVCIFLAMVHDIGKCTPLFVSKITGRLPHFRTALEKEGLEIPRPDAYSYPMKSPHALAGEAILQTLRVPYGVCSVVGAHHGKARESGTSLDDQLTLYKTNLCGKQEALWCAAREMILQNALAQAGYSAVDDLPQLSVCTQMLMCGLLIQADWIASNETYFPLLCAEETAAAVSVPDRAKCGLSALALPKYNTLSDARLEPALLLAARFGFSPNAMQECAVRSARSMSSGGLMILEAQMGTGKTEAALAAAEVLGAAAGSSGVFFGLPTQATSNGIFPRLADWASRLPETGRHTIRLVHGMAELNEDYRGFFRGSASVDDDGESGLFAHEWFNGKKQALLADYVVGTVDTALMAALSQRHVMLRHLGLCGKVVIIDEVHAYDAYMSRFLERMLRWLGAYHVPVILLSATLPRQKKTDLLAAYIGRTKRQKEKLTLPKADGYPLITWTQQEEIHAEAVEDRSSGREIQIRQPDETALAENLSDMLREGGCAGIIVNTVKRAQRLAETLKEAFPEKRILLYHAQFLAEDRIEREKELMQIIGKHSTPQTRNNVIVVGTQVLEQSLDIDFDYLISDLCPIDLLLQRIGRLHRHDRSRPAPVKNAVCSVLPGNDASGKIYDKWLLEQTQRQLPETVRLPEDVPTLVEAVYGAVPEDPQEEAWQDYQNKAKKEENKAGVWLLKAPSVSKYPERNSIVGSMDFPIENEQHAEASVRNGLPSADVLVMQTVDEDHVGFMSWIGGMPLRKDAVPSESEARKIAMQRLRLPSAMCIGGQLDRLIRTLEEENAGIIPLWQQSPWLRGELILLLGENGEKELCGYTVKYDRDVGFRYEKRSD